MGPLDAAWHLANLLLQPLALGAFSAALAKAVWRRALAGVHWRVLARDAAVVALAVSLASLVATGREGRMGTYAAMVAGCAVVLWWRGFVRPARR